MAINNNFESPCSPRSPEEPSTCEELSTDGGFSLGIGSWLIFLGFATSFLIGLIIGKGV
jgi:hypothetical protein